MGQVALTFRILPENPEVDLSQLVDSIKTKLPSGSRWNQHTLQPFAFGLKAIVASIIVEDAEGGPDAVQDALQEVENVQGVELVDMGRLL
jgi:elongation factor 1-beta